MEDPLKMQLTAKGKKMLIKSSFGNEVFFQIINKNEVEIKDGNEYPQLKAESEKVTSSVWISKTGVGYSRQFLGT